MCLAARLDYRRQSRPPRRQRLMRFGETAENGKILAGAELVAQALRLLGPYFPQSRPKWLNQVHLVAVFDDTPPQVVQVFSFGICPAVRRQLPRATIGRGQSIRHNVEIDGLQGPTLEGKRRIIEIARELVSHGFGETLRFCAAPDIDEARSEEHTSE